ncbi:hypothetical protein [Paenibacillus herberti]|uniref:Uncharacterized protein n=1 Tax=Paenibacillus herberti TaxID=1619309 RepID=A0A229NTB7_9BACL|nr:hypothetical protein [Paenibacillus herberti]OXM12985.1 hypothetical protein CGZ75_22615 [Paenibacillus herberti]
MGIGKKAADPNEYRSQQFQRCLGLTVALILAVVLFSACSMSVLGGDSEPPLPQISSESGIIKVYQSSYCWGNVCADYAVPDTMLKDNEPDIVQKGEELTASFPGKDPKEIGLTLFRENKPEKSSNKGLIFQMPDKPGVYYYEFSGRWASGDSASYAFKVEVE